MERNRASWPKTCRQLYKASALDRAKKTLFVTFCKKKRPKRSKNKNKCLFCGEETSRADHSFQKLSLTKDIHDKAVALGEDRIVACLALPLKQNTIEIATSYSTADTMN